MFPVNDADPCEKAALHLSGAVTAINANANPPFYDMVFDQWTRWTANARLSVRVLTRAVDGKATQKTSQGVLPRLHGVVSIDGTLETMEEAEEGRLQHLIVVQDSLIFLREPSLPKPITETPSKLTGCALCIIC